MASRLINRAHPLAQNLLACYVPATAPGGRIINLAAPGNGDLTTRTGVAVGLGITPEGPGLAYTGTATAIRRRPDADGVAEKLWGVAVYALPITTRPPTTRHHYIFGVDIFEQLPSTVMHGQGGTTANGAISVFQAAPQATRTGTIVPTTGAMCSRWRGLPAVGHPNLYVNGVQDVISNVIPTNITYNGTITTELGEQTSPHGVLAS